MQSPAAVSTTPPVLALLRRIDLKDFESFEPPSPKIRNEEDCETWKKTRGYRDYAVFLRRLNEAVVGYMLDDEVEATGKTGSSDDDKDIEGVIRLLDTFNSWIDEIPPQQAPQRFGNLAFRTWGKRLHEDAPWLVRDLLPIHLVKAAPLITPYLLESFGSPIRIDYGSGHETCFALFICCLSLIGYFGYNNPDKERAIVLRVFVRYLRLCWRLQDVYRLEPAGSHGVWGLDDYSFLGYIFGSAQLRDQNEIKPSDILQPSLPATNLYFLQIARIRTFKTGPFHEHSAQLYSIATGVRYWHKVNSGLIKMYEVEVLGKHVVVQHIPLGGLLEWDTCSTEDQET